MALNRNLFPDEFVYFIDGVSSWSALSNCDLFIELSHSPYPIVFGGSQELPSLQVTTQAQGDISVQTIGFDVEGSQWYKVGLWVNGQNARDGSLSLRFLNASNTVLETTSFDFELLPGVWQLVVVYADSPIGSVVADATLTLEGMLPNEEVFVGYPTATLYSMEMRDYLLNVLEQIPDFIVEEDKNQTDIIQNPFIRFTDVLTNVLSEVESDAVEFDYVRATDAIDGEESSSSLTDPYAADNLWLGWLAQQVGVRLVVGGSGFTSWASFLSAGIEEWTEWEENIVPGGTGADTYWAALENFNAGESEDISSFRDQIATGFNGVMSSTVLSLSNFVKTILNTVDEDDPFVFIRKHYRTNPWRLAIVVLEEEDPDPLGTTVRDKTISALPSGSVYTVLRGVSRSALILYDAETFLAGTNLAMPFGRNVIPANALNFVEDEMGTLRNLVLHQDEGLLYTGGGISKSRYFAISNGIFFFSRFGLTSGYVWAMSASDASMDLTSDFEARFLVSDIRLPASGTTHRIGGQVDKWALDVLDTGQLRFEWETGSGTEVATSTGTIPFSSPYPYFLRVTFDVDDPVQTTVEFLTAPTEYDTWTSLGEVTISPSSLDSSTAEVYLYNPLNTASAITGAIYRAKVYEGVDGASVGTNASVAFDLNFLGLANTDVHTAATLVEEDGPNGIDVTIYGDVEGASVGTGASIGARWLALKMEDDMPFFHFGMSPNLDDGGNPASLGDTLAVSGLVSADHDYTVGYADGTTSGPTNLGTNTTYTFDSDDPVFGGQGIAYISITETGAGPERARFTPELLPGTTTSQDDGFGATWTLTRTFETSYYYEPSSYIDRSCVMPIENEGITYYNGYGAGASVGSFSYQAQACSITYRRHWTTGEALVVNNMEPTQYGDYGWKMELVDGEVIATLWDGVIRYVLTWDESGAGRIGEWNSIVLVLNPRNNSVELWANGVLEGSSDGFFPHQWVEFNGASTSYIEVPDDPVLDITGDLEVVAYINSDDYIDAGLTSDFQLLIDKEGAWEFAFNQQTGVVRFSFEDGGTNSFTTATPADFEDGRPKWLKANVDVDNGGGGYTISIYESWDGEVYTLIDEDVTASGTATIETSNNAIRLGASPGGTLPFDGIVIRFYVNDVLFVCFCQISEWNIHSVSGLDQINSLTVNLVGGATVERETKTSLFPEFFPLYVRFNKPGLGTSFQFSQIGLYDHELNEKAITSLVLENSIT